MAPDDLALFAHRPDRRSYLHGPFQLSPLGPALEAGSAAATARGYAHAQASLDTSANAHISRARACVALEMPGRQDARAVGCDGHRELEMRGQGAVLREDRPAVTPGPDGLTPGGRHRFDRQD